MTKIKLNILFLHKPGTVNRRTIIKSKSIKQ